MQLKVAEKLELDVCVLSSDEMQLYKYEASILQSEMYHPNLFGIAMQTCNVLFYNFVTF